MPHKNRSNFSQLKFSNHFKWMKYISYANSYIHCIRYNRNHCCAMAHQLHCIERVFGAIKVCLQTAKHCKLSHKLQGRENTQHEKMFAPNKMKANRFIWQTNPYRTNETAPSAATASKRASKMVSGWEDEERWLKQKRARAYINESV